MDRAAAKTAAIFEASLRLFAASGIQGTPTAAIAKAAGIPNGTLFHYFPTKDALVLGLYRHCKQLLAAAITIPAPGSDVKARLEAIVRGTVQWALEQPAAFQFLRTVNQPPFLQLLPAEEVALGVEPHIALIQEGQAQGIVVQGPSQALYMMVSAQVEALVAVVRQNPDGSARLLDFGLSRLWMMLHPS